MLLTQPLTLDTAFYSLVIPTYSPSLTTALKLLTYLGDPVVLGLLILGLLIFLTHKKIVFFLAGNYCLAVIINLIIKDVIQRPRPEILRLIPETGYSFPSFHAMGSMAVGSYLLYFIWHSRHHSRLSRLTKILSTVILASLLLLVAFSRIYLGVHYLSDILAGWLGGLICTAIFITLYHWPQLDRWLNSLPPYQWLLTLLPTFPKRP